MKKMAVTSWCTYDFASTIFMMNVVSLCFVQWLDQNFGNGDAHYSIISAVVYGLSLFLYPIAGEICDRGWKMIPLAVLTVLSVLGTTFIGHCQGIWSAAALFILAYLTYQVALTYYNALLNDISTSEQLGVVSGLGVAARYLGTIFGLLAIGCFIHGDQIPLLPSWLRGMLLQDVAPGATSYANGFVPTGVMYFLFALPLFFFVKTRPVEPIVRKAGVFETILTNWRMACKTKNTVYLCLAVLFGGAPVYGAIHFMSVYLKKVGGVSDSLVIPVLMFSTLFSIFGGLGFGFFLRPMGNKVAFFSTLMIWSCSFLAGIFLQGELAMWLIGAVAGVGMGGFWAISRVLFLDVAPKGHEGEYMSLCGMVEVLCGFLGSLAWSAGLLAADLFDMPYTPQRASVWMLSFLGFVAIWFFACVEFPKISSKKEESAS